MPFSRAGAGFQAMRRIGADGRRPPGLNGEAVFSTPGKGDWRYTASETGRAGLSQGGTGE